MSNEYAVMLISEGKHFCKYYKIISVEPFKVIVKWGIFDPDTKEVVKNGSREHLASFHHVIIGKLEHGYTFVEKDHFLNSLNI